MSDSREKLQTLIDVVLNIFYDCSRWRLRLILVLLYRNQEEGEWMWGEPRLCGYTHVGTCTIVYTYLYTCTYM